MTNNRQNETSITQMPSIQTNQLYSSPIVARTKIDYELYVIRHSQIVSQAGGMVSFFLSILFSCLVYFAGFINTPTDYGVMALFCTSCFGLGYWASRIISLEQQQNSYQNIVNPCPQKETVIVPEKEELQIRPFVPMTTQSQTMKVANITFTSSQWKKLGETIFLSNGRVVRDVFAKANCIPKLSEQWPKILQELTRSGIVENKQLTEEGIAFFEQFTPLPQNYTKEISAFSRDDDDDDELDE